MMVKLKVLGLASSVPELNTYALVLIDEEERYRLPVLIHLPEMEGIALYMQGFKMPNPLLPGVLKNLASTLNVSLNEVVIKYHKNGISYADLLFRTKDGQEIKLDARASDAVLVALEFKCPIYTTQEILKKMGVPKSADEGKHDDILVKNPCEPPLQDCSVEKLKEMLSESIAAEDYERAAELKRILNEKTQK